MTSSAAPDPLPAASSLPRLSTGLRLLLVMTAALLPLGLIAVFASLESAQTNRLRREADARALAATAARQLSAAIGRESLELRTATTVLDQVAPEECDTRLRALQQAQRLPVEFALFNRRGRIVCRTPGFSTAPAEAPEQLFATEVTLLPAARLLRFEARVDGLARYGIGEIPISALADLTRPVALVGGHRIVLREGANAISLGGQNDTGRLGRAITVASPVAAGQVQLELTLTDVQLSAVEVLMTLLPLLMWLAAAIIAWAVVNRAIIHPLLQLQTAIGNYRAADGPLALPPLRTPASEIRDLGDAFGRVTEQLAAHERELEEGLARQTKLTREVHHRVKNNLQVVSSLINLHARGVADPAVADAYASIQRRVDALAVVHRNHYAELEENRGVGLRALIGELAANLRATAPASASGLAISLDLAPLYATQDVAVPVAFLITEIVELAMVCDSTARVSVSLAPSPTDGRALLAVQAAGLREEACRNRLNLDRFDRVITGLSRQLRAPMARDAEIGRFAIEISVKA